MKKQKAAMIEGTLPLMASTICRWLLLEPWGKKFPITKLEAKPAKLEIIIIKLIAEPKVLFGEESVIIDMKSGEEPPQTIWDNPKSPAANQKLPKSPKIKIEKITDIVIWKVRMYGLVLMNWGWSRSAS